MPTFPSSLASAHFCVNNRLWASTSRLLQGCMQLFVTRGRMMYSGENAPASFYTKFGNKTTTGRKQQNAIKQKLVFLFFACCAVPKYQEQRNADRDIWQLPARSMEELWLQQWQKGLPVSHHWVQPFSVAGALGDIFCYALIHFFSSCNIYELDRLGDDLAIKCSATQPPPALRDASYVVSLSWLLPVCPGPCLRVALHLRSQSHSTFPLLFSPSSTKELSFFFFFYHL